MSVKNKIQNLIKKMNAGVYEKEEVISLALLSAMAGESIFLLGPPGVAKSLIARNLKYVFEEGTSFDYLMSRFSTPDEIFGPISISKLKDEDKYERVTKNYLPDANVVFLDEIWKAGPSIQNSLLTVINEKIYRNGDQEIKLPLKALISASNELPMKNEGLEALWDRFIIRFLVEGVTTKESFNQMITKKLPSIKETISPKSRVSDDEYKDWGLKADVVDVPDNVFAVIHVIRAYINEYNEKLEAGESQIYVSDRKWRKIVKLLRTSAFLNDRSAVDLMDCFLIEHCLWDEPSQIAAIKQFVTDAIKKHGYSLSIDTRLMNGEINKLQEEVNSEVQTSKKTSKKELKIQYGEFYKIPSIPTRNHGGLKCNLIKKVDFERLTEKSPKPITLYNENTRNLGGFPEVLSLKKGKNGYSVVYNRRAYKLELIDNAKVDYISKKIHPAILKDWDKRVRIIHQQSNDARLEIENYKTKDLSQLSGNLFVNSDLVSIVEANLNENLKEIEKLEIDARQIQKAYSEIDDNQENNLN